LPFVVQRNLLNTNEQPITLPRLLSLTTAIELTPAHEGPEPRAHTPSATLPPTGGANTPSRRFAATTLHYAATNYRVFDATRRRMTRR